MVINISRGNRFYNLLKKSKGLLIFLKIILKCTSNVKRKKIKNKKKCQTFIKNNTKEFLRKGLKHIVIIKYFTAIATSSDCLFRSGLNTFSTNKIICFSSVDLFSIR